MVDIIIFLQSQKRKSMAEIQRLRAAAKIGSRTIEAMLDAARPRNTHGDIVAAGMQVLQARRNGVCMAGLSQ